MHIARVQPGMTLAVYVDPQNPVDMAIDWIRTGQLGSSVRLRLDRRPGPESPERVRFRGSASTACQRPCIE